MTESKQSKDVQVYLDRVMQMIRKSEELIELPEQKNGGENCLLGIYGLTRDVLERMRFTPEQLTVVNSELKRQGMPPLGDAKDDDSVLNVRPPVPEKMLRVSVAQDRRRPISPSFDAGDMQGSLENRKRKFNVMKRRYRI